MNIFFAFPAGLLLGLFYFGLLWLTVRRLDSLPMPALFIAGSFFGRTALCALGFVLIMQGGWQSLLVALLGFLMMRKILARVFAPQSAGDNN